jgi:hypothetical protein
LPGQIDADIHIEIASKSNRHLGQAKSPRRVRFQKPLANSKTAIISDITADICMLDTSNTVDAAPLDVEGAGAAEDVELGVAGELEAELGDDIT